MSFQALAASLLNLGVMPSGVRRRGFGIAIGRGIRTTNPKCDQAAKLERRKRMHQFDDQLWERQRAKWG